ncbi:hypothetical protein FDP41_006572 [Naegleria fowleri]|uniref:Nbr1 FW domain-containing protein n=1 Tax=Naegleria fowleri TaxID=5763 RepID=A0A6A5BKK4_NAEFO|nr:uncharacterized protein FDP41_006572 [Naegleria fowleri]KAF0974540.1 hypothetical protein FDP41_006572 [Naegleria fowleri]CAG4708418.1 unnamed protein product [Naegleria fowleri]
MSRSSFLDEELLADEDIADLVNYYNHHQQHQPTHGMNYMAPPPPQQHATAGYNNNFQQQQHQGSPFFSSSTMVASSSHQQGPSLDVSIETAIDEPFRHQWSNYDLKKDDEMYEKYNVALKIKNNANSISAPLLLNCRHEIHDKGNICEMIHKKTNVTGYYLDFLLFDSQPFTLQPLEEKIVLVSISRPSRTMVSHGKYYIQFYVLTAGNFQMLCHTQQVKVLTSKNKNNRTKRVSLDPTKQDISVKNLVPKEWQHIQTSHQVFEACFWDEVDLTGEKKKYTPPPASAISSSSRSSASSSSSNNNPSATTSTPKTEIQNNGTPQSSSAGIMNQPPQQQTNGDLLLQHQQGHHFPGLGDASPLFKNPLSPSLMAGLSSPNHDFLRSPFREDHHALDSEFHGHSFLEEPAGHIQNYIPISTHTSIIKIFQKQLDFYKQQMEILLTELKRHDKRMAETLYRQYASVLQRDSMSSSSSWDDSNIPSEEDLENMFNKMKIIKEQVEQSINDSKKPPCSPVAYSNFSPHHDYVQSPIYALYNSKDYDFSFDEDVTIPDYYEVKCNSTVLKTWQITNCGIPFPRGTRIVVKSDKETPLENDEQLLPLRNTIEDRVLSESELAGFNETKNISCSIKTPNVEGLYRREFCLQLPNNIEFGDSLVVIFRAVK